MRMPGRHPRFAVSPPGTLHVVDSAQPSRAACGTPITEHWTVLSYAAALKATHKRACKYPECAEAAAIVAERTSLTRSSQRGASRP